MEFARDAEPAGIVAVGADTLAGRQLRYYDFAMAAFAVILICSNLIGAGKQASVNAPRLWPGDLWRRHIILSAGLCARRCDDRSLWLCPGAPGGLGRLCRVGLCRRHVLGGGTHAAGAGLGRPGDAGGGVRPGAAHLSRVDHRLLGRRIRQFLRAGADESVDTGSDAVDADHRLDGRRAGGRFA